jgi:ribosomal protein L39E
MPIKNFQKKVKLATYGRRTKWAPVWAVLKKFGIGKRVHPSVMTKQRRSWRRTKLHVKPYKRRKSHFG